MYTTTLMLGVALVAFARHAAAQRSSNPFVHAAQMLTPDGITPRSPEQERIAAEISRKRASVCEHDAAIEKVVQTHFYHGDTACDASPIVTIEEPFDYCISTDGVKFFKYEMNGNKLQQCTYHNPDNTANGFSGDACCVNDAVKRCVDSELTVGQCAVAKGGLKAMAETMDHTVKAKQEIVSQYELKAPAGQAKKTLHYKLFNNDMCTGTPISDFQATGCHRAIETTANHQAGAFVGFYNMWSQTKARYCLFYQDDCNVAMRKNEVPYLCRMFDSVGTCDKDSNGYSHKVELIADVTQGLQGAGAGSGASASAVVSTAALLAFSALALVL